MSTLLEMGVRRGRLSSWSEWPVPSFSVGRRGGLGVRALAGAPLPQLAISGGEDGFLLVGAMALGVRPHEVEELACSRHSLAAADLPEGEPRSQWHAETLDRRLGWRVSCCHGRYITVTGLCCHENCASVVT